MRRTTSCAVAVLLLGLVPVGPPPRADDVRERVKEAFDAFSDALPLAAQRGPGDLPPAIALEPSSRATPAFAPAPASALASRTPARATETVARTERVDRDETPPERKRSRFSKRGREAESRRTSDATGAVAKPSRSRRAGSANCTRYRTYDSQSRSYRAFDGSQRSCP